MISPQHFNHNVRTLELADPLLHLEVRTTFDALIERSQQLLANRERFTEELRAPTPTTSVKAALAELARVGEIGRAMAMAEADAATLKMLFADLEKFVAEYLKDRSRRPHVENVIHRASAHCEQPLP